MTKTTLPSTAWLNDYQTAFGLDGMIALSWGLGSLFAEQIRQQHHSYPFLAVTGEAGSGKTALADSLLQLFGHESDSFNPNTSTTAGRIRKLSIPLHGPVVFEDANQDENIGRFDWNSIKDLYNGEFGRITGVKLPRQSSKQTVFRAALMVVQTYPVIASWAVARSVKLQLDRTHHTTAGQQAVERLYRQPSIEMIGFREHCLSRVDTVLNMFNYQLDKHRGILRSNLKNASGHTIDNHAMLMALADCLQVVLSGLEATVPVLQLALIDMVETASLTQ